MNFKTVIKEILPPVFFRVYRLIKKQNPGSFKYACPVCNSEFNQFKPLDTYYFEMMDKHEYAHPMFSAETMNFFQYSCPNCLTSDRNRLYALYLKDKLLTIDNQEKKLMFLDIAPDENLKNWIKSMFKVEYRSVDLFMENVDDRADITDLNIYGDNSFDVLLCSHVLEHVQEDKKAISELYRVLKPGGFGIVMVPVNRYLGSDLENPDYQSESDRWKYYGQNDHVRMYSKSGFITKLSEAGFSVQQHGIEYFGTEIFIKYGIHPRSVLYIVEK